jgi:hypothetical protein
MELKMVKMSSSRRIMKTVTSIEPEQEPFMIL